MSGPSIDTELRRLAEWSPEKTAFVQADGDRRYSYHDANERACRFANALRDRGVTKGDRVAFLSRTVVEHAVTYFGCLKAGAVPASLHHREAPAVIRDMIEDIRPRILVYQSELFEKIAPFADDLPSVRDRVVLDGEADPSDDTLSAFLSGASPREPSVERTEDDTAFICFSSGTTGTPKGIVHTNSDTVACAQLGQFILNTRESDVLLNAFTPSFIGWENMVFPFVLAGGTVGLMERWDPASVPEIIERESVTTALFVPSQWKAVLRDGAVEDHDLASFRVAGYAGEPMSASLAEELREHFTDYFVGDYGTTETHFSGTARFPDEDELDSIGRPVPRCDVRIVEPGSGVPSREVDDGETGELIVRGPSVAEEVWENPEKTAALFSDGWFFSGDLAERTASGTVRLLGRTDNMIISGGINIYAEGVEEILESHPGVSECGVVGIPDEEFGEVVAAYIVPTTDLSAEALEVWCRDHDELSGYQRPRQFVFVNDLPRTNTGKLDRSALRSVD